MYRLFLFLMLFSSLVQAEVISIVVPYPANWPVAPAYRKIIERANQIQTRYDFVLDFKPGGDQLIAPQYVEANPNSRIMVVAPKFAEHLSSGKIGTNDFAPIHALGEACWLVISTIGNEKDGISSLKNKDIFVGSVGTWNATHLTALEISNVYTSNVTYVPYKSNTEALFSMVANDGLNMVIERPVNFENFKNKNPNMKVLASSCSHRLPAYPNVKTLKEQGVDAPTVFFITMAPTRMDKQRQTEIAKILNDSTLSIGSTEIMQLSDCVSPVFSNLSAIEFYNSKIANMQKYIKKFKTEGQ